MVDRCRVWESHADPAVRRMSKPAPDPTYPTYTVSDTDSDNEITRVAPVTGLKSDENQLIDLIRCALSSVERPTLKPAIPDIIGQLQQLVREPLNRAPAVVNPPVPKTLEQMLRSLLDGKLGHTATRCPDFNEAFPFLQPGWRTEKTSGGFMMLPPQGIADRRPTENG